MVYTKLSWVTLIWAVVFWAASLRPAPAETPSWKLIQDEEGVWWFQNPEGKKVFLNTIDSINPTLAPKKLTKETEGKFYISKHYQGPIHAGDKDLPSKAVIPWAKEVVKEVEAAGFEGAGSWSSRELLHENIPYLMDLNLWISVPHRLFDPDFETKIENILRPQVLAARDRKNLVGYFTDNEIDWEPHPWSTIGPWYSFDDLPPNDPNRLEVLKILQATWPKIEQFNIEWGTTFKSFDQLNQEWQTFPTYEPYEALEKLKTAWLKHAAHRYFEVTSRLLRKYDSRHLNLGVRFRGYVLPEVIEVADGFVDAHSINTYANDGYLEHSIYDPFRRAKKPLFISEFGSIASQNRSGNPNTADFGVIALPDELARAEHYRRMVENLASLPFVVGTSMFRWSDEPLVQNPVDLNFGIKDIHDKFYEDLIAQAKKTNVEADQIHADPNRRNSPRIWRPEPLNDQKIKIQQLTNSVQLDGSLEEWNFENAFRLRTETIGAERARLDPPRIILGWRPEGLYLAAEVPDRVLNTSPNWMRSDTLHLWISTLPNERKGSWDQFTHQYSLELTRDKKTEEWGLKDNFVVQDPKSWWAKIGKYFKPQAKLEVHTNYYTIEAYIPRMALRNFFPESSPEYAINVRTFDAETSVEHFLSSSMIAKTYLKPTSWAAANFEACPPEKASTNLASIFTTAAKTESGPDSLIPKSDE